MSQQQYPPYEPGRYQPQESPLAPTWGSPGGPPRHPHQDDLRAPAAAPYSPYDLSHVEHPQDATNPYQSNPYAIPIGMGHPRSGLVLVLGIISVVGFSIAGPFAWVIGRRTLAEIDRSPGIYRDRGQVLAGMITGIIGTILLALGVIWLIVVTGFVLAASQV